MTKIITLAFAVLLTATANSQVKFEALQFSPQFPKAGQTVSFKYNAQLSPLIDEKNVDVAVYIFGKKGLHVVEPKITKAGKLYSGSFKADTAAYCIAFGFSAGKEKDANAGKGYIIPIYTTADKPVKEYYTTASSLQSGYGEYLFGMENSTAKAFTTLEEGLKIYPAVKYEPAYFGSYLRMLNSAKKT